MAEVRTHTHKSGFQRSAENKFRQSLKTLQISADEQGLAIDNSIHPDDKMLSKEKKSEAVGKLPIEEKENIVRRPRRAVAEKVCYTESPEQPMIVQSRLKNTGKTKKTKPKQGQTSKARTNKQKGALNQKKLEFKTVETDTTLIKQENENLLPQSTNKKKLDISADSGFDPASRVSGENPLNSTTVFQSPMLRADVNSTTVFQSPMLRADVNSTTVFQPPVLHADVSIITEANPPLTYWKNLAEKRRLALEKALHENELLHDQLIVLETENSQLKEVVRQAENLANILKDIVE